MLQQLKRKFFLQCATIRPPPSSPGLDWEKSVSCEKCSSKEFKFENNWPLGTKTTKIHNNIKMWTAVKNLSCEFWKKVHYNASFYYFSFNFCAYPIYYWPKYQAIVDKIFRTQSKIQLQCESSSCCVQKASLGT